MKKKLKFLLFFSFLFFISNSLFAQQDSPRFFKQGQKDAWIGVGLIPTYLMDGGKIIMPPVTTGGDAMIADNFSLGGQIGYSVSETQKDYSAPELTKQYRNSFYFIGFRGAAHCIRFRNLDIYGGFILGYNLTMIDVINDEFGPEEHHKGIKPKSGKFTYSSFLGVRYSCCNKIGLFGELGYGASILTVGTTYQL